MCFVLLWMQTEPGRFSLFMISCRHLNFPNKLQTFMMILSSVFVSEEWVKSFISSTDRVDVPRKVQRAKRKFLSKNCIFPETLNISAAEHDDVITFTAEALNS